MRRDRDGARVAFGGPTRFATTLAVIVAAVAVWRVTAALGVETVAAAAATGGVAAGAVVRLADARRFEILAVAAAVALLPPAGLLAAVGAAFVVLAQVAGIAPVGSVFVVVGAVIAALGAVALPTGVDRDAVVSALGPALGATFLAVVTSGVPLAGSVLANEAVELPEIPLAPVVDPVLFPAATPQPPVGTALVLAALAAWGARRTLRVLPVRELLDDGTGETAALAAVRRLDRAFGRWPWLALAGVVVGTVNVAVPGPTPWSALPTPLVGAAGEVAAAPPLRAGALGTAATAVVLAALARTLRAAYTREVASGGLVGAVAGWVAVAAAGWVGHATLVGRLRATIRPVLPGAAAETFTREADAVVAYYGGPTVGVTVVAAGTVLATVALLVVALGSWITIPRRGALGPGALGGGTFLVGAFGLAAGAGTTRSLVALVGGVFVWDLARTAFSLG
ncbi:MAG: hypothetical protein ABEI75_01360, partial [Halobaculum sp.]